MVFESIFVGMLCSLFYVELTGLYAGGIIVPGYIALYLDQPLRIVGTLLVSFLALSIYRLISPYLILYGRRRFLLMLLFGGFLTMTWYRITPGHLPGAMELRVIGWIIPGLIANAFVKQGILETVASMFIVTTITFLLVKALLFI
ncbi:poly-gamma-glutamate biosynthesis protein PgsC [Candidatus Bipolaricaulota bacterium]|nr:poly-gamma-glutamate biosynthesis protein PgsC [Candidatus Bipolaricaulota bacterium]MBS3792577.1 poly-gamma-glutamate biosynthesis protein PgsC [Candidatus Bipolaricaulota bacterium]MBS3813165.1 poly-gamma-glutamate biosynthesis protein PgsC [Candidatus Bipolaricaulota bacterium]